VVSIAPNAPFDGHKMVDLNHIVVLANSQFKYQNKLFLKFQRDRLLQTDLIFIGILDADKKLK